jgi:hypothetical protein
MLREGLGFTLMDIVRLWCIFLKVHLVEYPVAKVVSSNDGTGIPDDIPGDSLHISRAFLLLIYLYQSLCAQISTPYCIRI